MGKEEGGQNAGAHFKRSHTISSMAFKVFDLQCESAHVFEGWFASHADYDAQVERGLLVCPVCDSRQITRRVSAPRLNVSGATEPVSSRSPGSGPDGDEAALVQAQLLRQVRAVLRAAENVGPRFAEEARRIHEGEAPERMIRGTATPDERAALAEDGIAVMPVPAILDDERMQ